MYRHSGYGQPVGTGTIPMQDQFGRLGVEQQSSHTPFHMTTNSEWQQDQWERQFYAPSDMAARRGRPYYEYGGGGGGGGSAGGDWGMQHQSTAGEGLFALAIVVGSIAVVIAIVVLLAKLVLSLINRVAR